jgi:hypothetical protein
MRCIGCGSTAISERTERTAHGYCRFRCRVCGKQFNARSASLLNRTQYPFRRHRPRGALAAALQTTARLLVRLVVGSLWVCRSQVGAGRASYLGIPHCGTACG